MHALVLYCSGVAQLVEQGFCKAQVAGSTPVIGFMKNLLAIVMLLFVAGCPEPTDTEELGSQDAVSRKYVNHIGFVYSIEFEGHEYVLFDGNRAGGICHKVNCRFCQ